MVNLYHFSPQAVDGPHAYSVSKLIDVATGGHAYEVDCVAIKRTDRKNNAIKNFVNQNRIIPCVLTSFLEQFIDLVLHLKSIICQ